MDRCIWKYLAGLITLLWLSGCEKPAAPPAPPPSEAKAASPRVLPEGYLDRAQPRLQTIKVWVGAEELITELATNDVQRMTGMMYRTNMPENEAMLFVFPYAHQTGFYMRNTIVPLSAAYLDPKGVILEIHDLQPHNERSALAASSAVQYVLETTQGWFARHGITTGAVIKTEVGTLSETFFKRRPPR